MRPALAIAALLLAGGCTRSRTEAVVVVTTDGVRIPDDVDQIVFKVADTSDLGNPLFLKTFRLCSATVTSDCLGLPLDFTLVPGVHVEHSTRVQLTAQRAGKPVIDDAAIFTFAPGQSLRLDFVLYANCLGNVDCAARDQACGPDDMCQKLTPQPIHGEPDLAFTPQDLAVVDDLAVGADLASSDMAGQPSPDMTPLPDLAGCTPNCGTMHHCGPDPNGCSIDPNYCGTCTAGSTYCYQMAGYAMCAACGGSAQPCCPSGPACGSWLFCATGTCAPCGSAVSQACCAGSLCDGTKGLRCGGATCTTDDGGVSGGWTRTTLSQGVIKGVWSDGNTTVVVGAGAHNVYRKVGAGSFAFESNPTPNTGLNAVSGNTGGQIAVGDNGTVLQYPNSTMTWTQAAITGLTGLAQNGVFAGPVHYWVGGGNLSSPGNDSFDYLQDGGTATTGTTGYARLAVWHDGGSFVMMASSTAASYFTADGGTTWNTITSMPAATINLRGSWGTNASNVWFVADSGGVYKFSGGTQMTLAATPTANTLRGISGTSASDIWIVGDSGTVFHYNGSAWQQIASPAFMSTDAYYGVHAVSPTDVWIVGVMMGGGQLVLHGP